MPLILLKAFTKQHKLVNKIGRMFSFDKYCTTAFETCEAQCYEFSNTLERKHDVQLESF